MCVVQVSLAAVSLAVMANRMLGCSWPRRWGGLSLMALGRPMLGLTLAVRTLSDVPGVVALRRRFFTIGGC